ncbi:hypothetical protein [Clostridium botulinum]|nr:hypothetical protein [Clostridium botulinum]MBY6837824.1 hypothetical protein [Clostridium botulinum]
MAKKKQVQKKNDKKEELQCKILKLTFLLAVDLTITQSKKLDVYLSKYFK